MDISKLKATYRQTLPEPLRRGIRSLFTIFNQRAYNKDYFKYIDSLQANSYPIMAATIVHRFNPASVIDVGCGSGGLLQALSAAGNITCAGFEHSGEGRALCGQKGLLVDFVDLTKPLVIDRAHDLVICFEVAEHLPKYCADQLVASLASGPDRILFSAATPGQGGNDHVNEQFNSYWIEKFRLQNFVYDKTLTEEIRAEWQASKVVRWLANNAMVFFRI